MPYELLSAYLKLPVFGLVAARMGGLIMFQPLLSALAVPLNLRVLLVAGLAAIVTPFVTLTSAAPSTPAALALAMVGEVLLGGLIGLAGAACFLGLQMGGLLTAQESGLAFGQIVDPTTGDEESVLSTLYLQLGTVVFLIAGGHRALVAASLDTFEAIPLLGENPVTRAGVDLIVRALLVGSQVAIRVAAPAVLTLFMLNIAMGFVSRTVPQFNIATVGFSIKALVGFVIMGVALPSAVTAFTEGTERIVGWLFELIGP